MSLIIAAIHTRFDAIRYIDPETEAEKVLMYQLVEADKEIRELSDKNSELEKENRILMIENDIIGKDITNWLAWRDYAMQMREALEFVMRLSGNYVSEHPAIASKVNSAIVLPMPDSATLIDTELKQTQGMRDRFETIHCGNNKNTTRRNEHGDYVYPSVQDAWGGWQSCWNQVGITPDSADKEKEE